MFRHAARSRWKGRTARKAHMSYSKDREAFVHLMARLGWRLENIRSVLRDAGICQRAAEVECSVENRLIRASAEKATEAAWKRLNETAKAHAGARVTHAGDPRGCVIVLHVKSAAMGGEYRECPVPAQGYSASQMARMTGRA